jgi:hypothetical protein
VNIFVCVESIKNVSHREVLLQVSRDHLRKQRAVSSFMVFGGNTTWIWEGTFVCRQLIDVVALKEAQGLRVSAPFADLPKGIQQIQFASRLSSLTSLPKSADANECITSFEACGGSLHRMVRERFVDADLGDVAADREPEQQREPRLRELGRAECAAQLEHILDSLKWI